MVNHIVSLLRKVPNLEYKSIGVMGKPIIQGVSNTPSLQASATETDLGIFK